MLKIIKGRRHGGAGKTLTRWLWQVARERIHAALLLGLCGTAVGVGSALLTGMSLPTAAADPALAPQPPVAGKPMAQDQAPPMDQALQLVGEARQFYQQVQDYTCTFISQERIKGQLQTEHVVAFHFRKQPFSVYMRWAAPKELAKQEVAFVQGRNKDMMRVKPVGAAGVFGFVSIKTDDPRVMEHSRHTIHEAGLGNLIERFARDWAMEKQLNKTKVIVAEYEYNKRRCIRVEGIHTERLPAFTTYRNVVYFDKETRMPVRTESYDWPRPNGPVGGDLIECYCYVDLRFNVGLDDKTFNK